MAFSPGVYILAHAYAGLDQEATYGADVKQWLMPYLLWSKNQVRNWLDPYFWSKSKAEYEAKVVNVETFEEASEKIRLYKGQGHYRSLRPMQEISELRTLAQQVQALNPQVVVEMGTALGGTLFYWSHILPTLRLLVSIDLGQGLYGDGYAPQRAKLYELFVAKRLQVKLELMQANSQIEDTKEKLVALLGQHPIDFLFIHADHHYDGVKKDYELYAPLVRPGGLIAFHDIRPDVLFKDVKVYQLWNEIVASGAQTEEIVQEPYCGHFGIGLLTKE